MKKISTDHILSISALITAAVAVWIAVVEQQSNREYQRLSVEPYLELSNTNIDGYKRLLTNTGLGPARIETVDVIIDGKEVANWREAINILIDKPKVKFTTSGLWHGRQIQAGDKATLVHLKDLKPANELHQNISKMKMKICYCSMYKDCWIKVNSSIPQAIEECPVDSHKYFPR